MKPVLLVEDDTQSRDVIRDIFNFENVPGELVCVERGEEALEILGIRPAECHASLSPSLILMDMELPGMGGAETVSAIKANPATRAIPIWAVTAHRTGAVVDAALAAGCSGYFVKPIDLNRVAHDLRAIQGAAEIVPTSQKNGN